MDIKQYIESGILELYVLGQLSQEEMAEVAVMQERYPEVAQEILKISNTFEKLGQAYAKPAPAQVWEKIANQLPDQSNKSTKISNPSPSYLKYILGVVALSGWLMYFMSSKSANKHQEEYNNLKSRCDSLQTAFSAEYALLQKVASPDNQSIKISPTTNYQGINLVLHHNNNSQVNIIQVIKSPVLTDNLVLQLWALKEGAAPMPLNTFTAQSEFVGVDYVADINLYAITIEKTGGTTTPTMERMIGTIQIIEE